MKRSPSFEELQRPVPLFSPRRALYGLMKLFLRTVGSLSDGIRIGNTYGYDSGVMLDYVYKHRAGGRLGIGRLIDRIYLDAVGWRGIRARRGLVADCLAGVVREQLSVKPQVRLLDIACGGGEYDALVLAQFPPGRIEAERMAVSCLDPGGVLVFTVQPHHPQLELIARTLTSNTGRPWVMRLRSLELFREWLAQVQMRELSHRVENGIFGVAAAAGTAAPPLG